MFNFLHTFHPTPVLISLGIIQIRWYGLFIVIGALLAMTVALKLAKHYNIKTDTMIDLSFYLILFGIIGARIYDDLLEVQYYIHHPLQTVEIWKGGLAIHGGIIAGAIVLYFFAKKQTKINKQSTWANFWMFSAIAVTVLPLAQAIGRWGNYFNQELFGRPTNLPWGIPIDIANRPWQYISSNFFHPTFLYESIGNLIIFLILLAINIYIIKKKQFTTYYYQLCVAAYLIGYSILRFSLEFIRIDWAPAWLGLRAPQWASLVLIVVSIAIVLLPKFKKRDSLN